LNKKVIKYIPQVYAVNMLNIDSRQYIVAGSEGRYPSYIIDLVSGDDTILTDGPGGTMCIVKIPGPETRLVSVMGLFPPFIGKESAIYIHALKSGHWTTSRLFDLPFAHRCEVISDGEDVWLFAASVSSHKADPGDWSNPGELLVMKINAGNGSKASPEVLMTITRNHGMACATVGGRKTLCISGAEGIFSFSPSNEDQWSVKKIVDFEVSEFAFTDLDGDGVDELVTIEPFHGNILAIYKYEERKWNRYFEDKLDFGHGLCTGIFKGIPTIVTGNRSGDRSLVKYSILDLLNGKIARSVLENDVGPSQTMIFKYNSTDYILSANQARNEVSLYY